MLEAAAADTPSRTPAGRKRTEACEKARKCGSSRSSDRGRSGSPFRRAGRQGVDGEGELEAPPDAFRRPFARETDRTLGRSDAHERRIRRRQPDPADTILAVNNIEVIYDHVILVLKGVSLTVPRGGIVALLGANGAGKTTTLKAISNLLHAERGEVTKGSIVFEGERVDKLTPNELVRRGCIQVMEGRHCFGHLTIEENLLTGAFTRKDGNAAIKRDLELIYDYFPRLRQRRRLHGRLHLRRRAADVRHRPRHDVAARR